MDPISATLSDILSVWPVVSTKEFMSCELSPALRRYLKINALSTSLDNVISGNVVRDCNTGGINFWGCHINNAVTGNTIQDCGGTGSTTGGYKGGIVLSGVHAVNNAVDRCPIFHNTITGNSVSQVGNNEAGIAITVKDYGTIDWVNLGNVISGNTVSGPSTKGHSQIYSMNSSISGS